MDTINVRNEIIEWLVTHGGTDNGTTVMDFGEMSQVQLRASQVFIGPCFDEEYETLASTERPVQVGVLVEHSLNLTDEQYRAFVERGVAKINYYTALADAEDHAAMARAFALAVEAGRIGYLAGLGPTRDRAEASSPLTGFLGGGAPPGDPA